MSEDDFDLPVELPETAAEVEGDEPEVDETDDEAVSDPAGEPEAVAEEQAAPTQQSKANERVRRALAEAKEAKAQAAATQREMMELLKGQVSQRQAPVEDPQIERQRMELMSDYEKFEYLRNKDKAEMMAQFQRLNLQLEVQNDKAKFDSLISNRTELKRFGNKVEEEFQRFMQAGQPQSRESILKHLIGEAVLQKGGKALTAARATGQANISGQTTRPASSRSNVSGSEGRTSNDADAALARLKRFHDQGGTF